MFILLHFDGSPTLVPFNIVSAKASESRYSAHCARSDWLHAGGLEHSISGTPMVSLESIAL
jgi:hypothetical protein